MNHLWHIPSPVLGLVLDKLDNIDLHRFAVTSKTALQKVCAHKGKRQSLNAILMFRRLFGNVCNECKTYKHIPTGGVSKECFCRKCGHNRYPHFFFDVPEQIEAEHERHTADYRRLIEERKRQAIRNSMMTVIAKRIKDPLLLPKNATEIDEWIEDHRDDRLVRRKIDSAKYKITDWTKKPSGIYVANCIAYWYVFKEDKLRVYYLGSANISRKDFRENHSYCKDCNKCSN